MQTFDSTGVNATIPHDLGTVPGCIIIKSTSTSNNWWVYHSGMGIDKALNLNQSTALQNTAVFPVLPTSTDWTFGGTAYGGSGQELVAYLFANDTPGLIKCGTYTGTGNDQTIDVGFEPQWVMIKNTSSNSIWTISDTARGNGNFLQPSLPGQ